VVADPLIAVAAGAAGMAAIGSVFVLRLSRRAAHAESEAAAARRTAETWRELVATAPEGLYVWDHASGAEHCSRRLAVLLGLHAGTDARFDDVIAGFDALDAAELGRAAEALRRDGSGFHLSLATANGARAVHAVGVRATAADGRALADMVWMRDDGGVDAGNRGDEALVAAYDSFRALLDALPLPIWIRDAELQVAFANRDVATTTAAAVGALAEQAREAGSPRTEMRIVDGRGSRRSVTVTELPVQGWPGTAGFAVTATPGGEGRDQVLKSLATGVAVYGADARLAFFNGAFATLFRLDTEWLTLQPRLGDVLDQIRANRRLPEYADYRAFRSEQLDRLGRLEAPVETLMHLPDGATLRAVVGPYPGGGLAYTYEDVTDRLALERSVHTLNAVAQQTVDNLYEAVAVFGSDGRMKLCNTGFATLWRLDKAEIEAAPHLTDVIESARPLIAGVDDWADYKHRAIERLLDREPREGRLHRTDGTVLDYACVPLPDGAVMLGFLDVSDSVRVQRALQERAEALREADRLKSEFLANVSHEIRTPLTSVLGFAEVLAEEYLGGLNRRQSEYVRGILEASRELAVVIDDILDLSTIEAGLMTLELDTVDVHGLLASVLALVREHARRKSLHLGFDCPPDIGWIVCDEKRLKQVVFKLLGNVVRYTPPRGAIHLAAARVDGEMTVSVSDTGPGMAPDQQAAVFERGEGEPGLGLSLVNRFVELHGGRVTMNSSPGKGTTITCHLPAAEAKE